MGIDLVKLFNLFYIFLLFYEEKSYIVMLDKYDVNPESFEGEVINVDDYKISQGNYHKLLEGVPPAFWKFNPLWPKKGYFGTKY